MDEMQIENGKYTVINNNGNVTVKRYGEDWNYSVDKFTLCLIQEIEMLREEKELMSRELRKWKGAGAYGRNF